jgi:uncharacterized protein YndB with AHSA1/START domain
VIEVTATPGAEVGEVTITREFEAPRAIVFRAFIEPAQLAQFWGPTGTSVALDSVVIEPWPGGRFENVIVADDGSSRYPFRAIFVEVVEPERFTFREVESGLVSASTFSELGPARTRVVIHQTNVPVGYMSPEALAGFSTSLGRLDENLATGAVPPSS